MSPYVRIRNIAREQLSAAARGDLDQAVELLDEREALLAAAEPAAKADEEEAIRETLRLDRELEDFIRQCMRRIRAEAVATQQRRTAIGGYRPPRRRAPVMIDAQR